MVVSAATDMRNQAIILTAPELSSMVVLEVGRQAQRTGRLGKGHPLSRLRRHGPTRGAHDSAPIPTVRTGCLRRGGSEQGRMGRRGILPPTQITGRLSPSRDLALLLAPRAPMAFQL